MKFLKLISCLLVVFVFGCNESADKEAIAVGAFINQWNANHTPVKSSFLESDYMDVVTYYGKERTRQQVQLDKQLLFEQFPDYRQQILNEQLEITKEDGNYLVTFTKRVNYDGIEADYVSFLSLISKNHKFKILREGVTAQNENLGAPIFPFNREMNPNITKKRRLYGDFNGDGLSDYASVSGPEVLTTSTDGVVDCEGGCDSVISFSQKELAPIVVKGAYKWQLENLKDLNRDGADEIGFWDIKPTTKSLYVFDATNGALLCDPVVINTLVHKELSFVDVFKKTGLNKITVSRSALVNGVWVLESEVITLD